MPDTRTIRPNDNPEAVSEARVEAPHVVLVGNEKGGAGKSTVAMHLSVALMRMGWRVGVLDLDHRQRSLSRYLANRAAWLSETGVDLSMPECADGSPAMARRSHPVDEPDISLLHEQMERLRNCQFIIVDTPGGTTAWSREAHGMADTLITPLNDSFVDFDLLGEVDPRTFEVTRPSFYSELVWECRKIKAGRSRRQIDWVVMRNRMAMLGTRNKQKVGRALDSLAKRIGFRIAPGLSERVIYRELFPSGLTLLDLASAKSSINFTLSHVAARQELRDMLITLKLPPLAGQQITF